jgi:hypothetical protein
MNNIKFSVVFTLLHTFPSKIRDLVTISYHKIKKESTVSTLYVSTLLHSALNYSPWNFEL